MMNFSDLLRADEDPTSGTIIILQFFTLFPPIWSPVFVSKEKHHHLMVFWIPNEGGKPQQFDKQEYSFDSSNVSIDMLC